MASPIVYVPAIKTTEKVINAPTNIDKPDYPDIGVAYAGYSKTLLSGNQYRLNPQAPYDQTNIINYLGASTLTTITNLTGGKDLYCTKIIMYLFRVGGGIGGSYVNIGDGTVVRVSVMENPAVATEGFILDFPTPIKFSKDNNFLVAYSTARAAGDRLLINFIGWIE